MRECSRITKPQGQGVSPRSPCVCCQPLRPAECLAIPTEWSSHPDSDPSAPDLGPPLLLAACCVVHLSSGSQPSLCPHNAWPLSPRCPATVLKSVVLLGTGARGCFRATLLSLGTHIGLGAQTWGDVCVFNETYFLAPLPFLHPGQGCPPEAQGSLS